MKATFTKWFIKVLLNISLRWHYIYFLINEYFNSTMSPYIAPWAALLVQTSFFLFLLTSLFIVFLSLLYSRLISLITCTVYRILFPLSKCVICLSFPIPLNFIPIFPPFHVHFFHPLHSQFQAVCSDKHVFVLLPDFIDTMTSFVIHGNTETKQSVTSTELSLLKIAATAAQISNQIATIAAKILNAIKSFIPGWDKLR